MDHHKIDNVEFGSKSYVWNNLNYVVRAAIELNILDCIKCGSINLYTHIGDRAFTQAGILIKRDEIRNLYVPDCTSQMIHGGFDVFTADDGNVIFVAIYEGKLDKSVLETRTIAHSPIANQTQYMLTPEEISGVVKEEYEDIWREAAQNRHKNPQSGSDEKIIRLMHDPEYQAAWKDWSTKKLSELHRQTTHLSDQGKPELIALIEHYQTFQ